MNFAQCHPTQRSSKSQFHQWRFGRNSGASGTSSCKGAGPSSTTITADSGRDGPDEKFNESSWKHVRRSIEYKTKMSIYGYMYCMSIILPVNIVYIYNYINYISIRIYCTHKDVYAHHYPLIPLFMLHVKVDHLSLGFSLR